MNKTTFFWVFILNLVCIITMNAQEAEYAQYVKTTDIQDKELHQIVAEYDGKYYYCDDESALEKTHQFDAVEINKEDNNLLQLPLNVKKGFQFDSYSIGYKIVSYSRNTYCGINSDKLTYNSTLKNLKYKDWTFSFQPNGQVNIYIKITSKTYTIVFNTSLKKFILTTNIDNDNYTLPYIFKKQPKLVTNITISNTLWTTFYSDYCVHIPNGVEVYTIESVDKNVLIKNHGVIASESNTVNLKKNTPVLLHSKASGTYPLYESTDLFPLDLSKYKYLRGTSTDQMIEAEDGYSYYMLTYGTINNEKVFGFFYGAENGGPFVNKGGKAYLAVPTTIANQALGFSLGTDDDKVTSIENEHYNKKQSISSVTTLSGIRLNNTDKSKLPNGIYIIDGKKVFVK